MAGRIGPTGRGAPGAAGSPDERGRAPLEWAGAPVSGMARVALTSGAVREVPAEGREAPGALRPGAAIRGDADERGVSPRGCAGGGAWAAGLRTGMAVREGTTPSSTRSPRTTGAGGRTRGGGERGRPVPGSKEGGNSSSGTDFLTSHWFPRRRCLAVSRGLLQRRSRAGARLGDAPGGSALAD